MATHTPEPTTVPRRQRADAQRNSDRVLAAAREVFAERGPDATLEEIARRAEVGIGTLYRHYPSRNDLLLAVFRDDIDAARRRAAELLEADDAGAAFSTWLRDQLDAAGSCRALGASVMIQMLDEEPDKQSSCEALREAGAQLLERAQAAGAVRADANIDELLRIVSAIAMATEDAPDARAQADRLFTLAFDGIRA